MGMYTGIRCNVIIKKEYRDAINSLMKDENIKDWDDLSFDFMKEFGERQDRSSFIPFGCLSYMPWDEDDKNFQRSFNKETGEWIFQCSLKNYDDTIEDFFENVLSEIIEKINHLEVLYEEWSSSNMYKLKNGNIIIDENNEIQYVDDEDNDNDFWFPTFNNDSVIIEEEIRTHTFEKNEELHEKLHEDRYDYFNLN